MTVVVVAVVAAVAVLLPTSSGCDITTFGAKGDNSTTHAATNTKIITNCLSNPACGNPFNYMLVCYFTKNINWQGSKLLYLPDCSKYCP